VRDSRVVVERALAPSAEVRALLGELDAFLAGEYAPEQRHGVAIERLFEPHVRFFIARDGDAAVGCGGVALFDTFAEVKRMYVRPAARGSGVAQAVLARIESEARAAGRTALRLETGIHQHAAIRLYERAGFRACAAFEPYASMPPAAIVTSLFYEKTLG
jgi:putative acetyltransferase